MKKFANHPIAICNDPYGNGNIVAKLTHVLPGAPADYNSNDQGWYNHSYAQRPPKHAPAYIFKKPENNVQVFHFAKAGRDVVGLIVWHNTNFGTLIIQITRITRICELVPQKKHESFVRPIRVIRVLNSCYQFYSTVTLIPSLCDVNSGAYIHCIVVMPLLKFPAWVTNIGYSKT